MYLYLRKFIEIPTSHFARWQHKREARATHLRRVIECALYSLTTSSELMEAAKLVDGYLDDQEISGMLMKANWWVHDP